MTEWRRGNKIKQEVTNETDKRKIDKNTIIISRLQGKASEKTLEWLLPQPLIVRVCLFFCSFLTQQHFRTTNLTTVPQRIALGWKICQSLSKELSSKPTTTKQITTIGWLKTNLETRQVFVHQQLSLNQRTQIQKHESRDTKKYILRIESAVSPSGKTRSLNQLDDPLKRP